MYLNAKITPKGMTLSLEPAATNLDRHDLLAWQNVLREASLKLTEIAINHSDKQTKKLINTTNNLLRSNTPLSEEEINLLAEFEQNKFQSLITTKIRKLERDKVPNPTLPELIPYDYHAIARQPTVSAKGHASVNAPCDASIVNLSDTSLSADEVKLLSKGLNFCPTTRLFDEYHLLRDLDNFARNLRLREYFLDRPLNPEKTYRHRTNDWTPSSSRDKCLDLYITAVQKDILQEYHKQKGRRENLTKPEKACLKNLASRTDIIIKPADKGGAIVVMNTTDYIEEAYRQLSESKFYERLQGDPTGEHAQIVTTELKKLLDAERINHGAYKLMRPAQPRPGRFYMLPKIHKPGNPGRPIISGIGTVTEPISGYIDSLIRHIPGTLESYVKDTTDFLRDISDLPVPENSYLVTLDVSSLYTNIPHDDGIAALKNMYAQHRQPNTPDCLTIEILTRLVLELNSFEFNQDYFRQVSGTAMGTKMAPNYANIFMGKLESEFLTRCSFKPLLYRRYIDDIFLVWTHGEDELLEFIDSYNTVHPSIHFTHTYSQATINFLDVTITIEEGKLFTTLYRKPTDRQQYLHYQSDHPRHCKNSIPYSQAHRFKRICSSDTDFVANTERLKTMLCKQRYPPRVIDDAVQKAKTLNRTDLLAKRTPQQCPQRTNLCLTYSANFPNINKILKRHYNILEQSERLKRAFPSSPGVVYRRSRNLRDTLVKSAINAPPPNSACRPCLKPRCLVCNAMQETSRATSTQSKFSVNIRGNLTCDSSNVIYLLECSVCNLQYIGQTETPFRIRFNNHRAHAKSTPSLPLSKHLNLPGHSFEKLTVTLLETGFKSNREREQRESYLIYRFNTIERGINEHPGTLATIRTLK